MQHPVRGDWEFPAPPIRMDSSRVEFERAPLLGEHTVQILQDELGIEPQTVEALRAQGII